MTLEERTSSIVGELTASERKVATAFLADYPFAGLLTMTGLAKRAQASPQTVLRLTAKLGYSSYGDFQEDLTKEVKAGYHSPVDLHKSTSPAAHQTPLVSLTEATINAIQESVTSLPEQQFEAICKLFTDRQRSIYLLGGRMTHTIATFLYRHLRQIRPKVHLVSEYEEEWPDYFLQMGRKDVVVLFDCRRYQKKLEKFAARCASESGVQVVLFTDKWMSPVSRYSDHIVATSVDVGTPWDTSLPLLLLAEAIINSVSESDWDASRTRIEKWDEFRAVGPQVENGSD